MSMELVVSEIKKQEITITNYEELEKEITTNLEKYDNLTLTEDNKAEIKDIKSKLNKLSKAIDRERIDKAKEYNEPIQKFIEQCKTLKSKVDSVSEKLDVQLKKAEEKEKADKTLEILKYFDENIGEFKDLIDFDIIFNEQWLNKTYSMKKVQEDIAHLIAKTKMDLCTLDTAVEDEVIKKQVKDFYFKNIKESSVLSMAIQESKKIQDANQKIEELENTKKEEKIIRRSVLVNNVETSKDTTEPKVLQQLDFRVWVTEEQKWALKKFLVENNIEVKPIPKKEEN